MTKLRKHALSFALVALLAVGGAACGGDEGTTEDTGGAVTEPAGAVTEPAGEMTEPGGVGGMTEPGGVGGMTEPGMTEMATP